MDFHGGKSKDRASDSFWLVDFKGEPFPRGRMDFHGEKARIGHPSLFGWLTLKGNRSQEGEWISMGKKQGSGIRFFLVG